MAIDVAVGVNSGKEVGIASGTSTTSLADLASKSHPLRNVIVKKKGRKNTKTILLKFNQASRSLKCTIEKNTIDSHCKQGVNSHI
ncbi:MAG: hypothetical protein GWN00_08145 [Aliifodinibius sp.]|nr:hypothetical protein [Fodinibius sp.]NIY24779.1 hypothetical protein [Fodinibius sp.]